MASILAKVDHRRFWAVSPSRAGSTAPSSRGGKHRRLPSGGESDEVRDRNFRRGVAAYLQASAERCMVLNKEVPAGTAIGGHLFPLCSAQYCRNVMGLETINDPRNGVVWCEPFEQAYTHQATAVGVSQTGDFHLLVVNRTWRDLKLRGATRVKDPAFLTLLGDSTFGDFQVGGGHTEHCSQHNLPHTCSGHRYALFMAHIIVNRAKDLDFYCEDVDSDLVKLENMSAFESTSWQGRESVIEWLRGTPSAYGRADGLSEADWRGPKRMFAAAVRTLPTSSITQQQHPTASSPRARPPLHPSQLTAMNPNKTSVWFLAHFPRLFAKLELDVFRCGRAERRRKTPVMEPKREYPEVKGMDAQAAKEKLEKEYDGLYVQLQKWDGPPDSPKPMPLIFNPTMVWIWFNPETGKALEARAFC
ncbi:hypothetical protein WJX72_011514 [[Myrmecia] bisecta]|uniref:HNH nuclease domain-containing protein n=1 Tax=[Myrmecia] bisecta TaxID=41462 RepID=A0AAW1P818_9CHLO